MPDDKAHPLIVNTHFTKIPSNEFTNGYKFKLRYLKRFNDLLCKDDSLFFFLPFTINLTRF